ncbi:hypothetical protein [Ensifer sp.]|nr:hypothetical protein [Ensifer sp.]
MTTRVINQSQIENVMAPVLPDAQRAFLQAASRSGRYAAARLDRDHR